MDNSLNIRYLILLMRTSQKTLQYKTNAAYYDLILGLGLTFYTLQ